MRFLITILVVCLQLAAAAQEFNKTDAQGRKQGVWKKYHENGNLRYTGTFKDDQPVGMFTYYYDTGELQVEMKNTGKTAYSTVYYKTGEVQAKGKYITQQKDSTWTYYDIDGNKRAIETYSMGKKDKKWETYFPDGTLAEEKVWKDDFENGLWKQYFPNGKTKVIATYENGGLEGKAAYFRPDGTRGVSGNFYHGVRDGVWKYYEEDGQTVQKTEIYKNGQRVDKNKDEHVEDMNSEQPIPEDEIFDGMGPR
ncbi:MAG: toxin-antitoxin system YwqK family antitoxin [Flavobacteriales bacterium]|nr:toxin-antitoxin system YwqK family antitoxin [Flavobacteriales bacterium]